MKTVAVVVARMSSSRLPGKVLRPILGKPMIEQMVERIRKSKRIDEVLLATSDDPSDTPLADWAPGAKVSCFRGSKDDVLGRVHAATRAAGADIVVHLLADQPLLEAEVIDDVLDLLHEQKLDYAANQCATLEPKAGPELAGFPIGLWAQAYKMSVLTKSESLANEPDYREHSTSFIHQHRDLFRVGILDASGKWREARRPELNFAVNYEENFELVRRIFELCAPANPDFTIVDAIRAVDSHPELHPLMGTPKR